ncbi:hypothetical protein FG379_002654 [Cryptosporidium bovis]|uniref:uncharacterized protein n=1 Tax=Cryptosporidium bovis TaxID=310047 RepID=UPI00351A6F08|nr:hypothetical protein FG379_002654 [Cryptosporidium bovis]
MQLSERVALLERKIRDQNDAIEAIAAYMVSIMEENDELWKYIMRLRTKGREAPLCRPENNQKFRSRTPPPLQEPRAAPKEQAYCNRRACDYKNESLDTILRIFGKFKCRNTIDKFSNKILVTELASKYI